MLAVGSLEQIRFMLLMYLCAARRRQWRKGGAGAAGGRAPERPARRGLTNNIKICVAIQSDVSSKPFLDGEGLQGLNVFAFEEDQ